MLQPSESFFAFRWMLKVLFLLSIAYPEPGCSNDTHTVTNLTSSIESDRIELRRQPKVVNQFIQTLSETMTQK